MAEPGGITRADQRAHLRAFRKQSGPVWLLDGAGNRYSGLVANGEVTDIKIIETAAQPTLSIAICTIDFQSLKESVRAATAMGVGHLYIVHADYSASSSRKVDEKGLNKLLAGAEEVLKQSNQLWLPRIEVLDGLDRLVERAMSNDESNIRQLLVLDCDEEAGEFETSQLEGLADSTFVIGPEGGFSAKERAMCAEAAPSVVRTRLPWPVLTAPRAVLAALSLQRTASHLLASP